MSYPEFVDGNPPTITLQEYDFAPWSKTTCVDHRGGKYVVVIMEQPETIVAIIDSKDNDTLDRIFKSAMETHRNQSS